MCLKGSLSSIVCRIHISCAGNSIWTILLKDEWVLIVRYCHYGGSWKMSGKHDKESIKPS